MRKTGEQQSNLYIYIYIHIYVYVYIYISKLAFNCVAFAI